ncbi:MAG TPA: PAS domain S-box protein [Usitatibacteraceae bacterium]|nr:PAS domain S-box protein [Usitatibacteraceae bacterium]
MTMLARLWPRRLYRRVFALACGAIAVTAVAVTALIAHLVAGHARESQVLLADKLARAAATIAAIHLPAGEPALLDRELGALFDLPGVEDIVVTDPRGRVVVGLARNAGGGTVPIGNAEDLRPGPSGLASVLPVGIPPDGHLVAWAPIVAGVAAGHVRVRISMATEHAVAVRAWRYSLGGGFAVLIACGAALFVFLHRSLKPLAEAARFAERLSDDPGARLQLPRGIHEIESLTQSLNDASARLALDRLALDVQAARTEGILDTAPDTILGIDADGRIVFANAATSRIFGHTPEELQGWPLERLVPGFGAPDIRRTVESGILMGGADRRTATVEAKGVRNGGTAFEIEMVLGDVECGADLQYACVIRDITERRQNEESLRLATRALDCSGNGVVISDMRLPGEPVVYVNPAFESITGYAAGEAVGRNLCFLQGSTNGDAETMAARKRLRHAIGEGRSVAVEILNYRKDGSPFWNELTIAPVTGSAGAITHYIGVLTDITERMVVEQALAERGSRLDAIFSLSPDGFALFDARDRLAYVNPAFLEMVGIDQEVFDRAPSLEEFERALRERCDPAQPWEPLDAARSRERSGEAVRGAPVHLLSPVRILERHVRRTGDSGTTILYFRDVTRETEVDRMKSEFLSTAAHELRTPMASIFGFSELLLRRSYDENTRRDLLETVHRQAGLLINLLNELLDLSRIEARAGKDFKIRVQPLAPIVEDTVAALLVPNDPRVVTLVPPAPDVLVRVDAEKLRQALTNLLSNAYKYSPNGGEIRLDTLAGDIGGRPAVGLRVADRGIGMTAEQSSRAFERFYRADASGNIPGTGLGLCLVKEIVEIQGGRVDLASEAGRGTTVTVWLPLPDADLARAA